MSELLSARAARPLSAFTVIWRVPINFPGAELRAPPQEKVCVLSQHVQGQSPRLSDVASYRALARAFAQTRGDVSLGGLTVTPIRADRRRAGSLLFSTAGAKEIDRAYQ
ncbi:MAG: hypothetical protein ABSE99_00230 [Terracidiphilus sp.]|jgi:hypothetical protein